MKPCNARREGDELVCRACRLRWDVADAERPECRKAPPVARFASGGIVPPGPVRLFGEGPSERVLPRREPFVSGLR